VHAASALVTALALGVSLPLLAGLMLRQVPEKLLVLVSSSSVETRGASAPKKVLICRKFGHRSSDIF